VVDAAMVDGAALLMTMMWGFSAMGMWNAERGTNLLDTGAHCYDVFPTSDGGWVSIGSLEPQFYAQLLDLLGLDPAEFPQGNRSMWGDMKQRLTDVFATRTRDEWCALFEGTDVCFAPVLSMHEATEHPHNVQRGTFIEVGGVTQPAPAPRFSRTPAPVPQAPPHAGQHTDEALTDWGIDGERLAALRSSGAVA